MSIDKRVSHVPVLSHINQCTIDGAVTVRVIFTHRITDNTCTLTVRLVRPVIQLDHGIEHAALNRLQTVSYIRKCSGSDNTHSVVDIEGLHSFLQIDLMYFIYFRNIIKNIVVHVSSHSAVKRHITIYACLSRFLTNFAFSSINSRLGSTLSPIKVVNVRSISDSISSS